MMGINELISMCRLVALLFVVREAQATAIHLCSVLELMFSYSCYLDTILSSFILPMLPTVCNYLTTCRH